MGDSAPPPAAADGSNRELIAAADSAGRDSIPLIAPEDFGGQFSSGRDGRWWPIPLVISAPSAARPLPQLPLTIEPPALLADVGARHGHSVIHDPIRQRFLVFGGATQAGGLTYNDVWQASEASPDNWSLVAATGQVPPVRWGHSAVYDPIGDRMIVFGGYSGSSTTYYDTVWQLSLSGAPVWQQLTTTGANPAPRAYQSCVFDPARNRLIIFGGRNASGNYGDTWFLQLSTSPAQWVRLIPSGSTPAARFDHVAVLDAVRDRVVLYGGLGSTYFGDVWTLSLAPSPAWTQVAGSSAAGNRDAANAILDPAGNRMLVFGGRQPGNTYDQNLWALDLETFGWTLLSTSGELPAPRRYAAFAIDPISRRGIMQGGLSSGITSLNDTWTLTLDGTPAWTKLHPPPVPVITSFTPTTGPAGTLVTILGSTFNSATSVTFNSVASNFTLISGTEIRATVPATASTGKIQVTTPYGTGTSAVDFTVPIPPPTISSFTPTSGSPGMLVTISGLGFTGTTEVTFNFTVASSTVISGSVIHALVPASATSGRIRVVTPLGTATSATDFVVTAPPSPGPPAGAARYGAGGDFDSNRGRFLVVAGAVQRAGDLSPTYLNDISSLKVGTDSSWVQISYSGTPFTRRLGPSAVFDPIRDRLLIFGGHDGNWRNDLYELVFSPAPELRQILLAGGPSPRNFHSAVYDALRDRMLVFGGNSGTSALGDLWELTLSGTPAWRLLSAGSQNGPRRMVAGLVLDPFSDRLVLFGGWAPGSRNDLYQYPLNGPGAWTPITVPGTLPGPRHSLSFQLDPLRQRAILHGGLYQEASQVYQGSWELSLVGTPAWTPLASEGVSPAARYGHLAIVDWINDRMLVSGGFLSGSTHADVWRLQWASDNPTPVALALSLHSAQSDAIELAGEIGPAERGPCRLERSSDGVGWNLHDETQPGASGEVRFVDRDVTPGELLHYRISVEREGAAVRSEVILVRVPSVAEFALHGFSPNPSDGPVRVRFRLSEGRPATVELIDVGGRRVASRHLTSPSAGDQAIEWPGDALKPGLYFVRLTQGDRSAVQRGIVAP